MFTKFTPLYHSIIENGISRHATLVFIFDENLTFSDQISSLSKSCYSHIREFRCTRPYLDSKTAASNVHSKLDYCNSLYCNLPKSQINRLQQIQNCLARTVVHSAFESTLNSSIVSYRIVSYRKSKQFTQ